MLEIEIQKNMIASQIQAVHVTSRITLALFLIGQSERHLQGQAQDLAC